MQQTALLSVYNKTGIVDFAKQLVDLGWKLLASEGTAKELEKAKVPVEDISKLVGGPILGHQVVTLSRKIHAGLLASSEEERQLKLLGIPRIDLVCVGLYSLQEEINNKEANARLVLEKTDIGGPALLRSAAKGKRIVISELADRQPVIEWLKKGRPEKEEFIDSLAAKAEATTAKYSLISAHYHSKGKIEGFIGHKHSEPLYGENPWQSRSVLFSLDSNDPLALRRFKLIAGEDPSFVNWTDIDRLLQTITHISAAWKINYKKDPLVAVAVKHGNACGASVGEDSIKVLKSMINGDTRAIFGGSIMTNFPFDGRAAEILLTYKSKSKRLLDSISAPRFSKQAIVFLQRRGGKCRFLANPALKRPLLDHSSRFRQVRGGFLLQPNYTFVLDLKDPQLEGIGRATKRQEADLLLAWAIGSTNNSNTITLVREGCLIGNGVGQQDRVGAAKLAITRAKDAGHKINDAVAYSDSFFPFLDGPAELVKAGVKAILASSGSVSDEKVKQFCVEQGVALYLIPDKVGRGFYGH